MMSYFSGTGSSKRIANQLSKEQREESVFIPDTLENEALEFSLQAGEEIGFVFPTYSWAPPKIVLNFIRQLSLKGYKRQYLFLVCSCGDNTGLTRQMLKKALSYKGWRCHAGLSVTMPNNYILFPGFDVDNKELEEKKLADAVLTVSGINASISKGGELFLCHGGSMPFIETGIVNPLFNRFQMSPKHSYTIDACIGCKRCEESCPVENVAVVDGRPVWGMDCTSCLACYHVCPQRTVQYGERTKDKGQYFNPNQSTRL